MKQIIITKDEARSKVEGIPMYFGSNGRRFVFEDGSWYACSSNGTIEKKIPMSQIKAVK